MSVALGTKLGEFEILGSLGAGGMGEVYRARDSRLNRDVAIKVLLPAVVNDPDRLARFSREAQALASLNHPNIYGLDRQESLDANATAFIVMELIDGEELARRIARGPIPLDEALPIATQIAEALEAAHEQGIIHRDLKPANVKVRPDGTVKVLDFGLAKPMDPVGTSSANVMNSPTLSIHATEAGIIFGTAAYMSPEQARGKAVDRRADIWAFGCVLFEMLAGRRAFEGESISDTLASVLKTDPHWNALPADVPLTIRRLLRRCLHKDPKQRLRDIGEARIQIEEVLGGTAAGSAPRAASSRASGWRGVLPWAWAALLLLVGIVGTLAWRGVDRGDRSPIYAALDAPPGYVLGADDAGVSLPTRTPMVFTPDGRTLVIQASRAGKPQLFLRSLDRQDWQPIAGTDDARIPFLSPEGKWIGFWAANEIRKVPIEGGPSTAICTVKARLGPYGAAWGAGDIIVFGDEASGRIMRVPAGGGAAVPVTALPPSGRRHATPFFFPDGKRILFSDVSTQDVGESRLMVQGLDGGDARPVIVSAVDGRLLPSGQLAFMRLGTLMTAPFDTARAEVTGEAAIAMDAVMQSGLRSRFGAENTGAGMVAVSSVGHLAIVRGSLIGPTESRLIWTTPDGRASSAEPASGAPAGSRLFSRISPDATRAIVTVVTPRRFEMWLADWTRDAWTKCRDCYNDTTSELAVWSPDGARLLLGRKDALVAHTLDGSAPDQVLVQEPGRGLRPANWLADGRIVYQSSPDSTTYEIKLLERGGHTSRVLVPLGIGTAPEVSPEGRWLAYSSPETGASEVMVQAFPGPGSRAQISSGGGTNPMWSRDGRTLYYLRGDEPARAVVAVEIGASSLLIAGKPRELFQSPYAQSCFSARCYDISPESQRFLFRHRSTTTHESVTRMESELNWTATLTKDR